MDANQAQENITMFYFFAHDSTTKMNKTLHDEIRDTLGGISWVQIQVYGRDGYQGLYSTVVEHNASEPMKSWMGTRPVKITGTEEAHVSMTLAFSDRVVYTRESIRGGVQAVLKKIERDVEYKLGMRNY